MKFKTVCFLLAACLFASVSRAQLPATAKVTLEWDANKETDLDHYHVYVGTISGVYTRTLDAGLPPVNNGRVRFDIDNLAQGSQYFFAVTAANKADIESEKSNEVSAIIEVAKPCPPEPPAAPVIIPAPVACNKISGPISE